MNKQMVPVFVEPYDKESLDLFKNDDLHWTGVRFEGAIDINNPDKRLAFIEYLENAANQPIAYSVKLRIKGMIDFPNRDKEFREFKKFSFFDDLFKEMQADELQKKLEEGWTPKISHGYFFVPLNEIFFCPEDNVFTFFGPNTELALKDKDTGLIVEIPLGDIKNINEVTKCICERTRNNSNDIDDLGKKTHTKYIMRPLKYLDEYPDDWVN